MISPMSASMGPIDASDLKSPLYINLSISKLPIINDEVNISEKIWSLLDAPNTTAKIHLPEGVELINGSLDGKWDLKSEQPVYLNITVKFKTEGDFKIEAEAQHIVDNESSWGDLGALYMTIGRNESIYTPPPIYAGQIEGGPQLPNNVAVPDNITSFRLDKFNNVTSESIHGIDIENGSIKIPRLISSGTLTLHGYFSYYTDPNDVRINMNTVVPAKYFYVRIYDGNNNYLGDTYTDANGYWSISIPNPYPIGVRIHFYTYTKWNVFASQPEMRVISNSVGGTSGLSYVYYSYTGLYSLTNGNYDMGRFVVSSTDQYLKAFQLLGDLNGAFLFVYNNGNHNGGPGTILWFPSLSIPERAKSDGTTITISDLLANSADVAIHEYGHNVMWNAYGRNWWPPTNCPSQHIWSANMDVACAWTEGWANFLPLAVNGNPVLSNSQVEYVNLETPTWGTSNWDNGPGVEGRVAGALYDIYDNANDGADQFAFGFLPIAHILYNGHNSNFLAFWQDWLHTYKYSDLASLCIYQNTIDFRPREIGVYSPLTSTFFLNYGNHAGAADYSVSFGASGMRPIVGDWDGDGKDEIGAYSPSTSTFFLNYGNHAGAADYSVNFGASGMTPIVGDWDSDGYDEIGVYSPSTSTFFLNYGNHAGAADYSVNFGASGMTPIVGDWDGDGYDEIGVYSPSTSTFFLNYGNHAGAADYSVNFGVSGMIPIVGDWDGDGYDEIGVYRSSTSTFFLNYGNHAGAADYSVNFGVSGMTPLVGAWEG